MDNMYKGIIYKYTSPSGKVYIGQTRDERNRRLRWFRMTSQYYAGGKLEAARIKYGPENFDYEVLLRIEADSEEELTQILNQKEVEYISKYNSVNQGYNIDIGGNTQSFHNIPILQYDLEGNFVREWPSSKDVEINTGIKACNICLVLKGSRYQTGGYIFRYKIDQDFPLTIEITPTRTQKQAVCKYSLEGKLIQQFSSIAEAAKDCGINRNWLKEYLNGKDNHIYGKFIWKRKYE